MPSGQAPFLPSPEHHRDSVDLLTQKFLIPEPSPELGAGKKWRNEDPSCQSTRRRFSWLAAIAVTLATAALVLFLWKRSGGSQAQPESEKTGNASDSSYQTTVFLNWTVAEIIYDADGVALSRFGVNGKPAHLAAIHANLGDRIVLQLTNNLNVPTSIHFHGLFQQGSGFMDGPVGITQCAIAPGKSYTYDFTVAQFGTFFWHGHFGIQSVDGLRGPFIIQNPSGERQYDSDYTLQLADWYHSSSKNLLASYQNSTLNPNGSEPVWVTGVINGIGQVNCSSLMSYTLCDSHKGPYNFILQPGTSNRIRVVNTGIFAAFLFSIDGHDLTIIEVDGTLVEPYTVSMLTVNVAQRYSVLVKTDAHPGNYMVRGDMYHGDPWTSMPEMPPGFQPNVTAVLTYAGVPLSDAPTQVDSGKLKAGMLDDMQLHPINPPKACPANPTNVQSFLFEFSFATRESDTFQKSYPIIRTLHNNTWNTIVNSSRPTDNVVFIDAGQTIDILIRNDDSGEHPFHIHGHNFWILASGVSNSIATVPRLYTATNPPVRDVVTVKACPHDDQGCLAGNVTQFDGYPGRRKPDANALPATAEDDTWFGYVMIRFVADNPGVWLFHCHIGWHLSAGLAVAFVEGAASVPSALTLGSQATRTCADIAQWNGEIEG
ncbi:Cupredoxin [Chytriomyces sp. MP71]|nr:Cupredoxin [Chytriomyces sp. MP71]